MKFGCSIGIFLNSAHLICRSTDISKCFRGSLRLRDNESRLYVFFILVYGPRSPSDGVLIISLASPLVTSSYYGNRPRLGVHSSASPWVVEAELPAIIGSGTPLVAAQGTPYVNSPESLWMPESGLFNIGASASPGISQRGFPHIDAMASPWVS